MILNNDHHDDDTKPETPRPLPANQQNQILTALDSLGAKLVRSESERETMRKLLAEALDAQERLENQLERGQLDLQQRLSGLDDIGKITEVTNTRLNEQDKAIADNKSDVAEQREKQIKLEDKLRDSQQHVTKLQRRLDAQEQKRVRLQRRIERVESIALEAKHALEAKAVVLLTDRANVATAQLPYIDASAPIEAIENLHRDQDGQVQDITAHAQRRSWLGGAAVAALVVVALGIGWLGGQVYNKQDTAFAVLQDGTLAQIDVKNGTAQPVRFLTEPKIANATNTIVETPFEQVVADATNAETDIAATVTDLIVDEFLEQAAAELQQSGDVTDMAVEAVLVEQIAPTPVYDMERDVDLPATVTMLEDKAFEGIPEAQHDLAALYTSAQAGVTQDYERAAYWFRQAALQGVANAAYNLGVLHHQGLGVERNTQKAMDWYSRAAQLGHPEAQYNLGIAYIEGIGTPYSPNMAAAFFQQAALGGIVEAAYNLGLILENGLLGEVRPVDALRWYRGAAEKGSIEAENALHNLSDRLAIARDTAGLLDNGDNLATYMAHPDDIEPASGDAATGQRYAPEDMDLGALVPDREQIVVTQIQEQLTKMRYYKGALNGQMDADTIAAIKSYQIFAGLPATGEANEELLSDILSQNAL